MSGGHAASAKSDESNGVQLGKNLGHAGTYAANVARNALYNSSDVIFSSWKRIMGLLGDIAIKKPVSATLHLAGGPVAKILDTTATGVSKVLGAVKLGHGKKIKPTAWLLRQLNSLVASGVDSIVNVDPTWTKREWHGFRGYFRHVGEKMKKNSEELRAQKAAKKEARKARRAAVASAITGKSAGHHADAGGHPNDHKHPTHGHKSHAEEKHSHDHSDTHGHKAEEHHENSHEPKKHHDHAAHHDHDEHSHDDSHASHAPQDDHSDHPAHTNDDHHASADEHATHGNHGDDHHDDHAKPAHH